MRVLRSCEAWGVGAKGAQAATPSPFASAGLGAQPRCQTALLARAGATPPSLLQPYHMPGAALDVFLLVSRAAFSRGLQGS